MCIHHITFAVKSVDEAKKFYLDALAPLGYKELYPFEGSVGLGANGKPDLWLRSLKNAEEAPMKGLHVAFAAENNEQVDQFYEAALKAGATDNGPPGLRNYTPGYYTAFVIDPQGNNIEVVHLACAS